MFALLATYFLLYIVPPSDIWWLEVVRQDKYFVLLLPATLVVFVMFVFVNWVALKYFRSN